MLLVCISVQAQQMNFRHLSARNGLPSAQISAFYQDSSGFMWIGSLDQGAFRYNGQTFQRFDNNNGLSGNGVRVIEADQQHRIWIGTNDGLTMIDADNIVNYTTGNGLPAPRVNAIEILPNGNMLIGTSGGIALMENDSISVLALPDNYSGADIRDFCLDLGGRLWIATFSHGLLRGKADSGQLVIEQGYSADVLQTKQVVAVKEDLDGVIWIATSGAGFFKYDGGFRNFQVEGNRGANYVSSMLIDQKNRVWGTTWGSGIVRLENNAPTLITDENGLADGTLISAYRDQRNRLWFGYFNTGLSTYLGDDLKKFESIDGIAIKAVVDIATDGNTIYVAHKAGLHALNREGRPLAYHPAPSPSNRFLSVAPAGEQKCYTGTAFGQVYLLEGVNITPVVGADTFKSEVTGIIHDKGRQCLWVRTAAGGFYNFNLNSNSLRYIPVGPYDDSYVKSFRLDNRGRLWIGSKHGVYVYANDELTKPEELPDDLQATSISFGGSTIYLGSHRYGMIAYTPSTGQVTYYDQSKGTTVNNVIGVDAASGMIHFMTPADLFQTSTSTLGDINVNYIHGAENIREDDFVDDAIVTAGDEVWVGTRNGLLIYNATDGNYNFPQPGKLFIYDVKILKDTTVFLRHSGLNFNSGRVSIPVEGDHVRIAYTGAELTGNPGIFYQTMLEEEGGQWSQPTRNLDQTYYNISPGNYVFRVRELDVYSGKVLAEANIDLDVAAPVYQSLFFYIIIALALLCILIVTWLLFKSGVNKDLPLAELSIRRGLQTNRILMLLAAVLYPGFGFVYQILVDDVVDPPLHRAIFALVFAGGLLLSYRIEWAKRRLGFLIEIGFYLIILHLFYLFYVNDLRPEYAIGLFLVLNVVSLVIISVSRVILFMVALTLMSFLVYYISPGEMFNRNFFLVAVLTSALLSFVVVAIKVELTRRLTFIANLLNKSDHISLVFNGKGKVMYVSNNTKELIGVLKGLLMGQGWRKYFTTIKDGGKVYSDNMQDNFTNPLLKNYLTTHTNPATGEELIMNWNNKRIDGGLIYAEGQEVTASHKEQQSFRRYQSIVHNIKKGIIINDVDGRVLWVNDHFVKMTGYTLEEMIGRIPSDVMGGIATDMNEVQKARLLNNENLPSEIEAMGYTKAGKPIYLAITSTPLFNDRGEVTEFVEMLTDITDEKEAIENIELVRRRFRDMLDYTHDMIITIAPNGRVTHANQSWRIFTGTSDKNDKSIWDSIYPPKVDALKTALEQATSRPGEVIPFETILLKPTGSGVKVNGVAKGYTEGGEKLIGIILYGRKEE